LSTAFGELLFVLAIWIACWLPRTTRQNLDLRDWPALLFTAMLNVLRIRNGPGGKRSEVVLHHANLTMLVFLRLLMASIGKSRTVQPPADTPGGEQCAGRDCILAEKEL